MLSPRSTFLAAATAVADTVDLIPSTAWDGPGLGVWDLRALVGHTSRSLITVVEYLGRPAAVEEIATPEAYYAKVAGFAAADPAAVVERGRAAGAALGDDPAAAFRARLADAAAALDGAGDDDLPTTLVGGMRLAAYLPTRTFELAVHGTDIAAATGLVVASHRMCWPRRPRWRPGSRWSSGRARRCSPRSPAGPGCRPDSPWSDRGKGVALRRRLDSPARHARRTGRRSRP